jgi:hypothetical protein
MEGTNLGSDKSCVTESELEADFEALFRQTKGRVFVSWLAQNVDRTVTLYRACLKAGRTLVVDLYTAEVLEMLGEFGSCLGWIGQASRSWSPARWRGCIVGRAMKRSWSAWFPSASRRRS